MAINYKPLWILLAKNDMNKTELSEVANISTNAVAKMGKNEYVSLQTLEKICLALNCQLNDIVDIEDKIKM
ncbi:helix-turn-helix domain-containing protein [Streptococcus uberis]|uniref:helix-turn-helix domain-containing protein n=1 Tax=Streptococcus uberis TaxID=1349 RepID=UPI0012B55B8D|nr:helix-turn-helix domain-containing protein [Streptococcus uberis]MTC89828.1 helix-turn-helix domain-containing protein [Streptococcus uberis]MTC96758.1 helix-turn-helix domain-containing protein [Streptococcus uberis]